MEEGSVVANRVERGEYRGLTTNEVIVCVCVRLGGGGGVCIRVLQSPKGDRVNFVTQPNLNSSKRPQR